MKVVLFSAAANAHRRISLYETLRAFPAVDLVGGGTMPASLARSALVGAEILLAGNRRYTSENAAIIREAGTSLRWIQFTTSGIDKARDSGLPSGLVVTNMAGMRAFAVAEHAMFCTDARLVAPMSAQPRRRAWRRIGAAMPSRHRLAICLAGIW